jgi:hypothetical protein
MGCSKNWYYSFCHAEHQNACELLQKSMQRIRSRTAHYPDKAATQAASILQRDFVMELFVRLSKVTHECLYKLKGYG